MRFIWSPTDGALIPHILDKGQEVVEQTAGDMILHVVSNVAIWLTHYGVPLAAEAALLWGCICLVAAIAGSGKWMERGVKSLLASVMLGVVQYAI